jgi:glycosyltransferase involved in cell wall biosynthesis
MATTCLINNYNYARFVGDAVESALAQSVPFDEIIVVDDGSKDESVELLTRRFADNPAVRVVAKEHQGQLSCFNEGYSCSTGDIVFFLDADDVYEPNYLEQALAVYTSNPNFDFVFCGCRHFGQRDSLQLASLEDRDLGYSVILAAYLRHWIGASTSCLSMRRGMLEKILPFPFIEDWRIRADDCLVFGSSLAGARKYYLAQPLVRRRVHDDNRFVGCSPAKFATYRRRLAINTLFAYLERKFCYDVERLADFHHHEFCTIDKPTFSQFTQYLQISRKSRTSFFRRLACITQMIRHYLRSALRPAQSLENTVLPVGSYDSTATLRLFVPGELPAATAARYPRRYQEQAA